MRIGRDTFYESVSADLRGDRLTVTSQESMPPLTQAQVDFKLNNLKSLIGSTVPITFGYKDTLNGFYTIENVSINYVNYEDQVVLVNWNISATVLGSFGEVEVSTTISEVERDNEWTVLGTNWHAPAAQASLYAIDGSSYGKILRDGSEGEVPVYFASMDDARWSIEPNLFYSGAAYIKDGGRIIEGINHTLSDEWEIGNSIIRVIADDDRIIFSRWDSNIIVGSVEDGWVSYDFLPKFGAQELDEPDVVSIIRNNENEVALRLSYETVSGRIAIDLTVRRGAALLQIFVQGNVAGTLSIVTGRDAITSSDGYVAADADDADGHRWFLGSPQNVTLNVNGSISLATARALAAYFGIILDYDDPATGESGGELVQQYIGTPIVKDRIVRR